VAAKVASSANWQLIEKIADALIPSTTAAERPLLSKSLQESLFYSTGFDTELDYERFKNKFLRHIERQGPAAFTRTFLSLFFFNFAWYHTNDSFSAATPSPEALAKEMQNVERVCNRIVDTIWGSFERTRKPLDPATATKLVSHIDQAMRGS